ncbi:MAG: TMEM165/GDT1 family protein [Phycisphaerae bacterium]|jgi:putative Ca2+/H+ antiporter (TMEM165/GDT1 family)
MLGFWASFVFILLAEMGDKTQLVALSFATKYKPMKVIIGITIGTLACHLLSVVIGRNLSVIIPMHYLKLVVGLSFVGFGIWTLKGDTYDEKENEKRFSFGPVLTVAIAFFIAELGDKTQLATISLAAQYKTFWGVWFGSTLGMVIADGIAIVIGYVMGKKIHEKVIEYISAGIFILFGIIITVQAVMKWGNA